MYSADRHSHLHAPYAVSEPITTTPAQSRPTLFFHTFLKALRWISEIRVLMPFSSLEPGPWRDNRPDWYYY
jgi:hypothetical protein